jgi:uncharacterized repeat protein (TIGR02543 family)
VVSGDLTVTAQWAAEVFTLTYNNNGGSGCSSKTGSYGSTWGTLCAPTKPRHTFVKWKNSSGSTVNSNTIVNGDLTVTAEWSVNSYTLTYITKIHNLLILS